MKVIGKRVRCGELANVGIAVPAVASTFEKDFAK